MNNYSKHQLDIVTQFDDLESGAKALARSARSKGSRDDITVLLTEITEHDEDEQSHPDN